MVHAVQAPSLAELQRAVDRVDLPEWVRGVEVTEDLDADSELAVWLWIVVGKGMPPQEQAQPVLAELRKRMRRLLAEEAPGLWAYIRILERDESASVAQ